MKRTASLLLLSALTLGLVLPQASANPFASFYPSSTSTSDTFNYSGQLSPSTWSPVSQPCKSGTSKCFTLTTDGVQLHALNGWCNLPSGFTDCKDPAAVAQATLITKVKLNFSDISSNLFFQETYVPDRTINDWCPEYFAFGPNPAIHHVFSLAGDDGSLVDIAVLQVSPSSTCTEYTYTVRAEYIDTNGSFQMSNLMTGVPKNHVLSLSINIFPDSTSVTGRITIVKAIDTSVSPNPGGTFQTNLDKLSRSNGTTITGKIIFYNDNTDDLSFISLKGASALEFRFDFSDIAGGSNSQPNGQVDIIDTGICSGVYGKSDSFSREANYCDYNRSGTVDIVDFGILANMYGTYWGGTNPPTQPFPGQGVGYLRVDAKWSNLCSILATAQDQAYCTFVTTTPP